MSYYKQSVGGGRPAPAPKEWWTSLEGHRGAVRCAQWSQEGDKLASGSADKTARIWWLEPKVTYRPLIGHEDGINQLSWDPRNTNSLVTVSADKTLKMWDLRTEKAAHTLQVSDECINVAYSPTGIHFAVGNLSDTLSIYDVRKLVKPAKKKKYFCMINEFAWTNGGEHIIVTCGEKGKMEVLDAKQSQLKVVYTMQAHMDKCQCIAMDPSYRHFAVGGDDGLVTLWDLKEMMCVRGFARLDHIISDVSFNHDGSLLAYCSNGEDRFIDIAEVNTGKTAHEFRTERPYKQWMGSNMGRDMQLPNTYKGMAIYCLDWHPKRNLLAVGAVGEVMTKDDYPSWYYEKSPWNECMFQVLEYRGPNGDG
eukprot:TRINITY_DN3502_c0_g3_i1.p1 TRINITY_DN3502_c0_g3~~TRINITY_DN3502_c0_g3_i1.p1  ORF type:complete len:364 (+),score=45.84 TRINITY_DN3502_c0_g3_i1:110-1201(+)